MRKAVIETGTSCIENRARFASRRASCGFRHNKRLGLVIMRWVAVLFFAIIEKINGTLSLLLMETMSSPEEETNKQKSYEANNAANNTAWR
jgi:hypothetical protein